MKTALDNYALGKQQEVSADTFKYIVRDPYRFLCPECLEQVTMVDGKYSKYFKHHKKNDSSIECDRRVEALETQSISERVGLPLFLRRENNKYGLYIGFRALSEELLNNCKQKDVFVTILSKRVNKYQKYYVNNHNFSSETIVYKELEIADSNNLKVEFSDSFYATKLSSLWSNYIETSIFSRGALFQNGNCGGKIIRVGDCISTYKSYIWVRPKHSSFTNNKTKGVNFEKKGYLIVDNQQFDIFEGSFNVHSSDSLNFSKIANYLLSNLKLFLLDEDSSITPIWPPVIRNEIGFQSLEPCNMFYTVHSNNELPRLYSYRNNSCIPSCIFAQKEENTFLGNLYISSYGQTINVDRKVISNGTFLSVLSLQPGNNAYYLQETKVEMIDNLCTISFQTGTSTVVYIIDDKLRGEKFIFENGDIELHINHKIRFIVISCDNYLAKLYVLASSTNEEHILNTEAILKAIKSSDNSRKIILNSKIFGMMRLLIKENPELKSFFIKYIDENRVPLSVVKILERNTKI